MCDLMPNINNGGVRIPYLDKQWLFPQTPAIGSYSPWDPDPVQL